jgi:hypothetical protein
VGTSDGLTTNPQQFKKRDKVLVIHPVPIVNDRSSQNSFGPSRLSFNAELDQRSSSFL